MQAIEFSMHSDTAPRLGHDRPGWLSLHFHSSLTRQAPYGDLAGAACSGILMRGRRHCLNGVKKSKCSVDRMRMQHRPSEH